MELSSSSQNKLYHLDLLCLSLVHSKSKVKTVIGVDKYSYLSTKSFSVDCFVGFRSSVINVNIIKLVHGSLWNIINVPRLINQPHTCNDLLTSILRTGIT
ncbi:hypothetical protein CHS0354_033903 [Potamilus streckersoni]|uniref:Uncharacterized protein n=1 Tax=Potamilus streckersoni TaxID=2493646 RepID=A0AAE0RWX1_9BIVA|nr:hypothetical protein CHS0354_033903 [Potamilus streckersoni]